MKFNRQDFTTVPDEFAQKVDRLGCCTAWELKQQYGITRQKISRAIRAGKLHAFMKGSNGYILIKWYIVKDDALEAFIKEAQVKV